MNEKHLTYFKVENFKRFESFELNNIGQFNLILGDNNVGKTSVLEALLFDEEKTENYITNLTKILEYKNVPISYGNAETEENDLLFFTYHNNSHPITTTFSYPRQSIQQLSITADTQIALAEKYPTEYATYFRNKEEIEVGYRMYAYVKTNEKERFIRWQLPLMRPRDKKVIPLVFFAQTQDNNLAQFYSDYVQDNEENKKNFIDALRLFIPDIKDIEPKIKPRQSLLYVRRNGSFMPLSFYGDGVNRLVSMLLHIPACRGKRLMIDEIDAGVHFKKFKDFWRTILLAAQQNEVQLFATTHNLECLQAFKEVLEETELIGLQQDARCFELIEMPDKQVKAYSNEYIEFATMIETGTNIRGGK